MDGDDNSSSDQISKPSSLKARPRRLSQQKKISMPSVLREVGIVGSESREGEVGIVGSESREGEVGIVGSESREGEVGIVGSESREGNIVIICG